MIDFLFKEGKDGNLEYENLEPQKRQSRINLESYWGVFVCVCGVGVCGGGGAWL